MTTIPSILPDGALERATGRVCVVCPKPALTETHVLLCKRHWLQYFEEQADRVRHDLTFYSAGYWASLQEVDA